jgi:DNA-binding response OmpR family regulator
MSQVGLDSLGKDARKPERILVVEDDEVTRQYLTLALEDFGYEVSTAESGGAALEVLTQVAPDLILLDTDLSDMSGIDVCHRLRALTWAPIIFVSGRVDEVHKVMALDAGGDDYLTKPFALGELGARIRAALRRRGVGSSEPVDRIEVGGVVIDRAARGVTVRGAEVDLTPREFHLLWLLMQSQGRVLERQRIVETIWGAGFFGDTSDLNSYILHLRQKLESNPHRPRLIRTIHGIGYRFEGPD